MRAIDATTDGYFEFIVNDLYEAYKSFDINEEEFNKKLS